MPRIFDNMDLKLVSALRENLPHASRMDVSVGYFNLRGWGLLDRLVEELPEGDRVAQPQRYVNSAALGSVRYVLTTVGPTLFLYERTSEGWTPEPVGHLDIASIQRSYLLPEGTNPVETLVRLQPSAL